MAAVRVIDAAMFRDTATAGDTATAAAVSVEEAAGLAGVSVRTIRRWLQRGYLPYKVRGREKLIAPADLPAARRVAGGHGHDRGHYGQGGAGTATVRDTATLAVAPSPAARAQLVAVGEELLAPLVERIGALEREVGQLTGERAGAAALVAELRRRAEAAEVEREALRGELARLRAVRETPAAPVAAAPAAPAGAAVSGARWWGRLRAAFGGR